MKERVTEDMIQREIEEGLKIGDSSKTIESYFNERELPVTYDQYTNTYRSLIKKSARDGSERKFTVKIFLDDNKQFRTVEVRESFTYL